MAPEARRLIVAAGTSYDRGDYRQAVRHADAFLAAHPLEPEAAEALYVRGLARLRQQNADGARADLHDALHRSTREDLTARAEAQLGTLAFENQQWGSAIRHFERALSELDAAPPTDQIRLLYGIALQRTAQWGLARRQFSAVVRQFPSQPTAAEARQRLAWADDAFAIQCGAFHDATLANRRLATLRRAGLAARLSREIRNGRTLWIVYVGRYATYDQARIALPGVHDVQSDAFVVP